MKLCQRILVFLPLFLLLTGCGVREISAPQNARAVWSEDYNIAVSWTESSDADIYRVFRKEKDMQDFRYIADTIKTKFVDDTIQRGVEYEYKVIALSDEGKSEGANTNMCMLPDRPETEFIRIFSDGSGEISWSQDNSDRYCLYGVKNGERASIAETEDTSYILENIMEYDAYYVSGIYSQYNVFLETELSEPMRILPSPRINAISRLDKSTNVLEIAGDRGDGLYQIYRSTARYKTFELIGETTDNVFYDKRAATDVKYYYQVQIISERAVSPLTRAMHEGYHQKKIVELPVIHYFNIVTEENIKSGIQKNGLDIWASEFREDLQWLKDNGYTPVTTDELGGFLEGHGMLPEKPIMLLLNDGKLGIYQNAYPLLKEYCMKAVLAIPGSQIENATADPQKREVSQERYCNWDEIHEMHESLYIDIISQSYNMHIIRHDGLRSGAVLMNGEDRAEFYTEAQSDFYRIYNAIQRSLGKKVYAMSYPGFYRDSVTDEVWRKCGYTMLFTNEEIDGGINYIIQGIGLNDDTSLLSGFERKPGVGVSALLERKEFVMGE